MVDLGWLIFFLAVGLWIVVLYVLHRKGWMAKDKPLTLYGPFLMIKTLRGRELLDRIAQKARGFWNAYGDLGIVLCFASMVGIVALLAWEAILVLHVPASAAPQPSEALALPGINPYIPLGYGVVALIIGVVLHELSHGVLARANNVKIRSLGILWAVVPVGAFVEQDDTEMNKATPRQRDRIAAAGVMANFVLALVFLLLLSGLLATSVQPKADGVAVYAVLAESPAQNASLAPGDIITQLNGTPTPNAVDLRSALDQSRPGENVSVSWYSQSAGGIVSATVTLSHASAFETGLNASEARTAFLGIEEYELPPQALLSVLQDPFGNGAGQAGLTGVGFASTPLLFLALPFVGLEPLQGSAAVFFTYGGPLGFLGPNGILILVNLAYWLAWMNLLVGLSNSLPAFPFDGGFLFRDAMMGLIQKFRSSWSEAKKEGVTAGLQWSATFAIIFLILWQFVGPHL